MRRGCHKEISSCWCLVAAVPKIVSITEIVSAEIVSITGIVSIAEIVSAEILL